MTISRCRGRRSAQTPPTRMKTTSGIVRAASTSPEVGSRVRQVEDGERQRHRDDVVPEHGDRLSGEDETKLALTKSAEGVRRRHFDTSLIRTRRPNRPESSSRPHCNPCRRRWHGEPARPTIRLVSAVHPSASFSATIRVRLGNHPGAFAELAAAIGAAGGLLDAIDLVRVERGTKVRDVAVLAGDGEHMERMVEAVRAARGRRGAARLRPHFPAPPRRQAGGRAEGADPHARRPLDGLYAGRGAHLPRDRGRPRERLEPDDQAELRRRRHRRDRRPRARRHRARGGASGDGGQGGAVQGVRRDRRASRSVSTPPTRTRSSPPSRRSRPCSAASTSRTSPRRAASRSSGGCGRRSTSRSSTTTSTGRRSSCSRRS